MQKTLKKQWFFTDFINLERLSLTQLNMKGFEKSPDILTVIVWCVAFLMKRHVGTIRCNVFAVSILLFFMKQHVGAIRCNVSAVSISWLFI